MSKNNVSLFSLKYIKVSRFSLYAGEPQIYIDFNKPIVCLAGANGLGKSTFLNIIGFSLTGLVKRPNYNFKGISDIRKMNYSGEYFKGRIRQVDSEISEVEVSLEIGENIINIKRSFANSGEFLSWRLNNDEENFDEKKFEEKIIELMGLDSFEQFIFIVHYLLMFDESKEMVFWNTNILTNAINLLLGIDSKYAAEADRLSRLINQYDSKFRNLSWDITEARRYINKLEAEKKPLYNNSEDMEKLREDYMNLKEEIEEIEKNINNIKSENTSVKSLLSNMSAKKYSLKREFDEEYKKMFSHISGKEKILNNNIVMELLENEECPICGANHINVDRVRDFIEKENCPLCLSDLHESKVEVNTNRLKEIDIELNKTENELKNLYISKEKLEIELNNKIKEYEDKQYKLSKIEVDPIFVTKDTSENVGESIDFLIKSKYEFINMLTKEKDENRIKRDEAKAEAQKLRNLVTDKYLEIQGEFIPIFSGLASEFIGLNANLRLQEITTYHRAEYKYVLELGDSERLYEHQLSESQRYFIDIALRMTFIIYASKRGENKSGILLLDTPEGSLDIAYETNAGKMLYEYALNNMQLILTANVNSSGLLKELSKLSGSQNFKLIRMINWSQLTNVQEKNLKLIEDVLNSLENGMEENN
ncbi:AAA domain-containing protein [Clostridium cavendishii DSM 21758]|uniref:Nuclease SbcCD subunit C n=1 Tax=Clostridium cavendishii DSM 21758 TaxID=1121302 RepID=A0A1M6LVF7_9CLOT|nr:AAA family ATPase [Clostridium cavendishii]SHJ75093.1 AAA domain-containing protein [Clostridium cavendishii DSM 21758]